MLSSSLGFSAVSHRASLAYCARLTFQARQEPRGPGGKHLAGAVGVKKIPISRVYLRAMQPAPSLPRTWLLHTRTFWLGLLVTAFFLWLTVDSFLYVTAYRTIHRGDWRDWSEETVIPAGTPAETGSFVAKIYGGCIFVSWSDHLAENASYYGTDERTRLTADDNFLWTPRISGGRDSLARGFGIRVPTWLLLLGWLGIWARLLVKSRRRQLSYLAPGSSPAP